MASDIRFATPLLNAMLDTVETVLGAGALVRFYDGVKPATADTALGSQVKLAENAMTTPDEFGSASGRSISANSITSTTAIADGTCTWLTICKSDGTRIVDLTVGEAADSADVTVDNKNFVTGATIAVTSLSLGLNL